MKKFTLFLILLQSLITIAQAPQKMAYQSVVRNVANQIVANQSIGVKISIVEGSLTGTTVYSETHTTITNANGLFTLEAGGGTPTIGTFSAINWSNGSHYIKSEIDSTGGTNYNLSGTTELLSVPYALYSEKSGNASLINTTTEPAGTNCVNGGTKIEVGLDSNSNGVLDSSEINTSQTKFVCNGTNSTGGSGGGTHMQLYTSSGTFTVPIGVSFVMVELWGAGGGGGCGYGYGGSGGGGAGGCYKKSYLDVISGELINVTIGSKGIGGSGGGGGTKGGDTIFGSYDSAPGGNGGGNGYGGGACVLGIAGGNGDGGGNGNGRNGGFGGGAYLLGTLGGVGGAGSYGWGGAGGNSLNKVCGGGGGGGGGYGNGVSWPSGDGGNGGDGFLIVTW